MIKSWSDAAWEDFEYKSLSCLPTGFVDNRLVNFDFARIIVGSFQQRTGCTHCESYIAASDR